MRIAVAVVALLVLPPILGAALVAYGLALFCGLHGFFGAGDSLVVLFAAVLLIVAFTLTRVCLWVRQGRKLMVRSQRIALGLFTLGAVTPAIGWYLASIWPAFPKAYWSVVFVYAMYGLWLAVDAWEDRWSL